MNRQRMYLVLAILLLAVPPVWAWRTMDSARDRAVSTFNQLESTRTSVQSIVHARADAPPAEISIQRPSGLQDSDTRYSVDLAFEREYISNSESER